MRVHVSLNPVQNSRFIISCVLLTWMLANKASGQEESKEDSTANNTTDILILPIITFSPETSLRFGVTAIGLFKHKSAHPSTHFSSFRAPISYTLNNQVKVRASFDIFSNRNDHVFLGFAEWFRFPLLFWGIGDDTPNENEELYTTESFASQFQYLSRVKGKFFMGGMMNYLNSTITEVDPDGQLVNGEIPGNEGGQTLGIGLLARLDSRDHPYNCTNGVYFQTGFLISDPIIGSDFDFNRWDLDFRYYIGVVQGRHVLAFQFVSQNIWGDPSFETMALLGGDQIMRGHYLGRYRDNSMYSVQAEYRLPLGRESWSDDRDKVPFKERWGVVGFVAVGNVAPGIGDYRFSTTRTSLGVGVRYLALPKQNINVRVDFGFGSQFPGIYFNVREAF